MPAPVVRTERSVAISGPSAKPLACLAAVLLAVAGISSLLRPGTADAHLLYACLPSQYGDGPYWCHLHTRYYSFYNGSDNKGYTVGRDAQIDWHQQTTLDLSTQPNGHIGSEMHYDDTYSSASWDGMAFYICAHGCTQHAYTNDRVEAAHDTYAWRAVACQEIGHGLGHAHHWGDCMGYHYYSEWMDRVSSHTVDDTNSTYAAHL